MDGGTSHTQLLGLQKLSSEDMEWNMEHQKLPNKQQFVGLKPLADSLTVVETIKNYYPKVNWRQHDNHDVIQELHMNRGSKFVKCINIKPQTLDRYNPSLAGHFQNHLLECEDLKDMSKLGFKLLQKKIHVYI